MTPLELELHAQLIHAIKWIIEGFLAAGILSFLCFMAPRIRGSK